MHDEGGPTRQRTTLACAALVSLGALLLAGPGLLARIGLTPDGVEYAAIAHGWLEGRGWVDPIVFTYQLAELHPPAPAFAIRAPLVSLLFALPLAFGAGIPGLTAAHLAWASVVGGAGVWVARRAMSLPAAVAFGAATSWSWAWVTYSRRLLTEVTACAVLLLSLWLVRGVASSQRRALLLGATIWLGWLARPNVALLLPAVLLAAALEMGVRGALRARPLWTLLLSCAVLQQLTSLGYTALTGFAPYSHYNRFAFVVVHQADLFDYRSEPVELFAFLRSHVGEIAGVLSANLRSLFRSMFAETTYLHVGWPALPALAWALCRRGVSSLERRTAALSALLLLAVAWLIYGSFDPVRSPFLAALVLWFVIFAGLDDLSRWLAGRLHGRARWAPALRALPLLLVVALWVPENAPGWLATTRAHWSSYRLHGTRLQMLSAQRLRGPVQRLCAELEPDALVASVDPWEFLLRCGNAGLPLPQNLDSVAWVDRYLAEQAPAYVVVDRRPALSSFVASSRLRRVASAGPLTLYEVKDPAPGSRPWHAPRPLAPAGSRARPRAPRRVTLARGGARWSNEPGAPLRSSFRIRRDWRSRAPPNISAATSTRTRRRRSSVRARSARG